MPDKPHKGRMSESNSLEVERAGGFIEAFPPGQFVFPDTCALIYLAKVDLLGLFARHYKLHVARAVIEELFPATSDMFPETKKIKQSLKSCYPEEEQPLSSTKPLCGPEAEDRSFHSPLLHSGERGMLGYYQQKQSGFILTDDLHLIRYCQDRTIPFTSSILVPCLLFRYGVIDKQSGEHFLGLIYSIGYFSPKILAVGQQVMDTLSSGCSR